MRKSQRAPAGGPFVRLNRPQPRVTLACAPAAPFPGARFRLLRRLDIPSGESSPEGREPRARRCFIDVRLIGGLDASPRA